MISHATSRVNQYTDECNRWASTFPHSKSFYRTINFRMQNRLRVTELKHEMANIHATKLQSQLKSFIKVSRWSCLRIEKLHFFLFWFLQTYFSFVIVSTTTYSWKSLFYEKFLWFSSLTNLFWFIKAILWNACKLQRQDEKPEDENHRDGDRGAAGQSGLQRSFAESRGNIRWDPQVARGSKAERIPSRWGEFDAYSSSHSNLLFVS